MTPPKTAEKSKNKGLDALYNKLFQWEVEGYEVSSLKKIKDPEKFKKAIKRTEKAIKRLKEIKHDLAERDTKGFEAEVKRLKRMLKYPSKIKEVEEEYGELRSKLKEAFFLSVVEEGVKVIEPEVYPSAQPAGYETAGATTPSAKTFDPSKYPLEAGFCYLIEEDKPDKSYKIFKRKVDEGHPGLCITREFPEKVKKKHGLENVPIFWLSNTEAKNAFKPVELGKLLYHIEKFLEKNENSIVMLSGLEYLITQNNYSSVLKLIQLLNEQIALRQSVLIVPVSPLALDKKDLKLIEREMEVIGG